MKIWAGNINGQDHRCASALIREHDNLQHHQIFVIS